MAVPSWLISTFLHLVILLILALISTPAGSGLTRVLLTIGQGERDAPVELSEFSIDSADSFDESLDSFQESEVEVEMPTLMDSFSDADGTDLMMLDVGAGPQLTVSKPMFGGRSGSMKQALLSIYGGTQQTEDAVARGLKWLKAQQLRSGHWSMRGPYSDGASAENHVAATSMALLAFMGAGNTHVEGEYSLEVERGVRWLISQQDRKGFMASEARSHEQMYAQAQATIVLCELYAMTRDEWIKPSAQLAIDFAGDSQSPEGGWRYRPRFDSDTSVTGWFVMGLQSGLSGELQVKPSVMYRVNDYLDSVQSYDGAAYSYQRRGAPSPAMTAEGLLCRQYLGWKRDTPAMQIGLESLVNDYMLDMSNQDVYYWYYATQALHHFGGPLWNQWNAVMRKELPAAQVKRGPENGSWSPQRDDWGGTAGRLYTTCLSIYCLEVYYRHMPLYSASGTPADAPEPE